MLRCLLALAFALRLLLVEQPAGLLTASLRPCQGTRSGGRLQHCYVLEGANGATGNKRGLGTRLKPSWLLSMCELA